LTITNSQIAEDALTQIELLYEIERHYKDLDEDQ